MPLILGAQSATAAGGFSVANSCRFNPGDDPTLTITSLGTPTDQNKWTFSAWVKRSRLTSDNGIMRMYAGSATYTSLNVSGGGALEFDNKVSGSFDGRRMTSANYLDPASWYHYVAVYDSDNVTGDDRMIIYVNGTRITALGTDSDPGSGTASGLASGNTMTVGSASTYEWGGYMAEVALCDGQAYAASDFGEFDEDTPTVWKPKDISGLTFGDEGFYLDFADSAALGNDVSGNNNDFTAANLAAADQGTDTPTNNFCTCNPLDAATSSGMTYSDGNTLVVQGAAWRGGSGTFGASGGKWYWECKMTGNYSYFGVATAGYIAQGSANYEGGNLGGNATTQHSYSYGNDGKQYTNNAAGSQTNSAYGTAYTTELIGVALNLDDNELKFYRDNVVQNSGTAIAIASGFIYMPYFSFHTVTSGPFNFGGSSGFVISSAQSDENDFGRFEYEPPTGFLALCTKNLGSDGG